MDQADFDSNAQAGSNSLKIAKLIDRFWTNPETRLTIEEMIRITGMSRRTLFYSFRESTGYTPHKYFKMIRLHHARQDLSNGARNVTQIAVKYNFNHLGDFSALYRQTFGELPSRRI